MMLVLQVVVDSNDDNGNVPDIECDSGNKFDL